MTWSSVASVTPNTNRNMAHSAVLKISRRFKFSAEMIENVQWGWHQILWADRSWGKLICRVSTYNNRLISFSNVSLTIRRPCSHFLQNLFKPDHLAKEGIEAIAAESQQERYIYSVHVWLPSVYITPRWSQSLIIYFRINVLTISDLVFSSISNTKCKQ